MEIRNYSVSGYREAYGLGRTKIYESMVKGENSLEAGTPVSFEVLRNEIKGLGLNMQLEKRSIL